MKLLNKVRNVRLLGGYRLSVTFRDGFVGEIDLWPHFQSPRGPTTQPFQSETFFQGLFLDHGTVTWPNGYDICSDVLRYYCEIGRVCSREELDAAFNPQPAPQSASMLNDKPNS